MATVRKMSEAERLERLEASAHRAKKLATLPGHVGWEEMRTMLTEQQELYDGQILSQAKSGTLTDRELHRYEDTSRAIKAFLAKPDRVQKRLDNLLKKVEQARSEEGDE